VTAAQVLTWAGFVACSLATVALSARSLRHGLPKFRQAQARLTQAKAYSRAVQAHLSATRQDLETWAGQSASPVRPAAGNGDHARGNTG
jgi:hypothetical protein